MGNQCCLCEKDVTALQKHHISYNPVILLFICIKCHHDVHQGKNREFKPIDKRVIFGRVNKNISISKEQAEFVESESINLSRLVQKSLEEKMKEKVDNASKKV